MEYVSPAKMEIGNGRSAELYNHLGCHVLSLRWRAIVTVRLVVHLVFTMPGGLQLPEPAGRTEGGSVLGE